MTQGRQRIWKTGRRLLLMAGLLGLCTACLRGKVYDHYEQLTIAGWEKNDTITFCVPPVGAAGLYSIDLGLRATGHYPFMSLTLVIEQQVFSDTTQHPTSITHHPTSTTLPCRLTDQQGHTRGQGVNYYQYNFHVADLPLQQGDSLRLSVRHDMKREILPGISDLGIAVSRK